MSKDDKGRDGSISGHLPPDAVATNPPMGRKETRAQREARLAQQKFDALPNANQVFKRRKRTIQSKPYTGKHRREEK